MPEIKLSLPCRNISLMPKSPINSARHTPLSRVAYGNIFRRQQRQIVPPADLPSSQPARPADATGNSCRPDPTLHSLKPAIPADAGKGCRPTSDPTCTTGNSCRLDPTLHSLQPAIPADTGKYCRQLRIRTTLRPANIAAGSTLSMG